MEELPIPVNSRSDCTEGSNNDKKGNLQNPLHDIREAWTQLWRNRIDDKVRAESIANRDYFLLFIDRGTVIVATKDFKPVNFKEILRLHGLNNDQLRQLPPSSEGGFGKFARTVLNKQKRFRKLDDKSSKKTRKHSKSQPKKNQTGWLHFRMKR